MGFKRNTIPDKEYLERLNAIMPYIIKHRQAENKEQKIELFFLYNDRLTPRKTKLNCGSCAKYVRERMEKYYNELNETKSTKEE